MCEREGAKEKGTVTKRSARSSQKHHPVKSISTKKTKEDVTAKKQKKGDAEEFYDPPVKLMHGRRRLSWIWLTKQYRSGSVDAPLVKRLDLVFKHVINRSESILWAPPTNQLRNDHLNLSPHPSWRGTIPTTKSNGAPTHVAHLLNIYTIKGRHHIFKPKKFYFNKSWSPSNKSCSHHKIMSGFSLIKVNLEKVR